jgi:ubiquinone/menaquinone biosynthesis C-methylase UbiE
LPEPPLSSLLTHYVRAGTVLDIGCGRGVYTARLLKKGYAVVGIDINRPRLRRTSRLTDVSMSDCRALPFKERSFDLVCMLQILHHIERPKVALDEISRVLKDGGRLYITEVVEDNPLFRFLRNAHPSWEGDPVKTRLKREELKQMLASRFSMFREDMSNGNFHWLWWVFGTRIIDPHKLDTCFVTRFIRFIEKQIDRSLKSRFSCTYQAILTVVPAF